MFSPLTCRLSLGLPTRVCSHSGGESGLSTYHSSILRDDPLPLSLKGRGLRRGRFGTFWYRNSTNGGPGLYSIWTRKGIVKPFSTVGTFP